jgi:hypothetical protein
MKKLSILSMLFIFGCTGSEDNASTNLRKGDEFMARGDYEIAEYYYDQIPEESVLYKTVQRRRQEMEKKQASEGGISSSGTSTGSSGSARKKAEGVTITKQSYILQMGKMPLHTITILNNTSKKLNIIEMEFVYINDAGREVARLLTMVNANADPEEEKVIGKIMPGMVNEKFSRVQIDIKRTLLF